MSRLHDDYKNVVKVIFPDFDGENQDLIDSVNAVMSGVFENGSFRVTAMDDSWHPPVITPDK